MLSEEHKKKISESMKKRYRTPDGIRYKEELSKRMSGVGHFMYGKNHSDESKEKMRKAKEGTVLTEEHKRNIGIASKRIGISDDTRAKMVASRKVNNNYVFSEEQKEKLRIARRKRVTTDETRRKIGESVKGQRRALGHRHSEEMKAHLSMVHKEMWNDPIYQENWVNGMKEANNQSPNECEILIGMLLQEIQPDVWEFIGDGKKRWGRKNPDFWNGDGKFIEHFGVYWHGDNARCYEETEQGRIEHFKKYGFDTLIIWDVELHNQPDLVRARLEEFVNN